MLAATTLAAAPLLVLSLRRLLRAACRRALRAGANLLLDEMSAARWDALPERILLLRHGQSEANVDHSLLSAVPDSRIALTSLGVQQAYAAGCRLRSLLGRGATISVVMSPFERTQETLCHLLRGLAGVAVDDDEAGGGDAHVRVREVHVDPRVREPPGAWQPAALMALMASMALIAS